jgi:hypothetical protein
MSQCERNPYEMALHGRTREGCDRGTTGNFPGNEPLSASTKPGFGFFQAVRAYCMRMTPSKES